MILRVGYGSRPYSAELRTWGSSVTVAMAPSRAGPGGASGDSPGEAPDGGAILGRRGPPRNGRNIEGACDERRGASLEAGAGVGWRGVQRELRLRLGVRPRA